MFKVQSTSTAMCSKEETCSTSEKEEAIETTLLFSCRRFLEWIDKRAVGFPTVLKKQLEKEYGIFLSFQSKHVLTGYWHVIYNILAAYGFPFLLIHRKTSNKNVRYKISLDLRHYDYESAPMEPGLDSAIEILGAERHRQLVERALNGKPFLLMEMRDDCTGFYPLTRWSKLPTLDYMRMTRLKACVPLHQLADLPPDVPDPQSLAELQKAFQEGRRLRPSDKRVTLIYCITISPKTTLPWYTEPEHDPGAKTHLVLAFSKMDGSIGYAPHFNDALRKLDKRDKKLLEMMDERKALLQASQANVDPAAANRRAAVSVYTSGLLQARLLRICTQDEMHQMTDSLASCIGRMWITCDNQRLPRHVLYADFKARFAIELKPCPEDCDNEALIDYNEKQWSAMFAYIQKSLAATRIQKRKILAPLMSKLRPFASTECHSNWNKCYQSLQNYASRLCIFVFGTDDFFMHALKTPFSGTIGLKNRRHGVTLTLLPNNTITAMSCSGITILNLADYLKLDLGMYDPLEDDTGLWMAVRDWVAPSHPLCATEGWPPPDINGNIETLKRQKPFQKQTMAKYVRLRADRNVTAMAAVYYQMCMFFMRDLSVDFVTLHTASLSKLAFESIWLQYAKMAGPLGHAIEKCSPYVESLIRPHCKGGFSFSCQDELKEGAPMAQGMEPASSIKEYDLTSAYGFAGLNIDAAKGFGVSFGGGMGAHNRYSSFEFRAVMYTIHKMRRSQGLDIASVYSNFSHLGYVTVNRYPLDLVVILEDGTIEMFNMDGHFCHGDYAHPSCPTLPRYANNMTRDECEDRSYARDGSIKRWMAKLTEQGVKVRYTVLTDCCDPEYTKESLKSIFDRVPELGLLSEGMDRLPGLNVGKAMELSDVAFMLVANVSMSNVPCEFTQRGAQSFGPFFDQLQESATQTTAWSKDRMLLTSNYCKFLRRLEAQHGMKLNIDSIEWIIYYKKDPLLNEVFKNLLEKRVSFSGNKLKAGLIKAIVNYGCGYFGLNNKKSLYKTKARIVSRLPKAFSLARHSVEPIDGFGNRDLLLVRNSLLRKTMPACPTPLALFVAIVEHGKMMMANILSVLQTHLRPTAFRLLYSNVDNIIVALASDTWDGCIKPDSSRDRFYADWSKICMPEAAAADAAPSQPGKLKLEWSIGPGTDWRFVSPFCMYYAILTSPDAQQSMHKTSAFTNLRSKEAYDVALSILHKQHTVVPQKRRRDKLVDTSMHTVLYNYYSSLPPVVNP